MVTHTGAEAVAQTLKALGGTHFFGLPGGQDPIFVALSDIGVRVILTRSEKGAALMADGYARVNFKPGICSAGIPGIPLLVAGLHEAYYSSIPVVAITNDLDPRFTGKNPLQQPVQLSLFERITKAAYRVEEASRIPEVLTRAFWTATTGRPGPVVVVIPDNKMFEKIEVEIPEVSPGILYPTLRVAPDKELITRAAKVLTNAARPAIVAGGGVITSQGWKELVEVAEMLGAPVATTLMGKGAIEDGHPASIGITGYTLAGRGGRGQLANEIVRQADVALLVGNKTDGPSTSMWKVPSKGTKIIHIDIDVNEIGRNYPVEIGIIGDAKLSLKALKEEIAAIKKQVFPFENSERGKEIKRLQKKWREQINQDATSNALPIKPQRLMEELKSFIDKDTVVVADAGGSTAWAFNYLNVVTPGRTFIAPRGFAAIGCGFPMALGAKLGAPEKRVFCIAGDGGFGYDVMELETALRENIPVVTIILNNRCLAMQKEHGLKLMGRHAPVDLLPTNYADIGKAIGCFGVRVERPEEIRDALARGLAAGKPAVVDVVVDPEERPTKG